MRARDGFVHLARRRDLALHLGGAVAALALFSMSATAEPFFVTDVLGAGSLAYGVLLTSWTLGMAAGSAGPAHRVPAAHCAAGGLAAIVLQGAGLAGAAVSPVLWMALVGFVVGGVAHGVKNVLLRTLIHERVPEALRGRSPPTNGARNGAELGALALGGLVVGAFGARPALFASGAGPALIGLVCLLLLTMRRRAAAAHGHHRRERHPCTCPGLSCPPRSSASTRAGPSTRASSASRSSRCPPTSRPTRRPSRPCRTTAASATTGATCSTYHLRPGHFVQTLEPVQLLELSPVAEHDRTMAVIARNLGAPA